MSYRFISDKEGRTNGSVILWCADLDGQTPPQEEEQPPERRDAGKGHGGFFGAVLGASELWANR